VHAYKSMHKPSTTGISLSHLQINLTSSFHSEIKSLIASTNMSEEKSKTSISVKLDGSNYNLWNFLVCALLKDNKCIDGEAEPVPGTHPLKILDSASSRAMVCITNNCTQEILVTVMNFKTPGEIWNYLYEILA
jgi:hypothetical protein